MKDGYYIYHTVTDRWYDGRGGWGERFSSAFAFQTPQSAQLSDAFRNQDRTIVVKVKAIF